MKTDDRQPATTPRQNERPVAARPVAARPVVARPVADRSLAARAKILLSGFLPGALAGTQLAGLLFFLNPDIPFDSAPILRGIGIGSLLLGAASLAVLLPWTWNRPERAVRWLPIHLTVVLAVAGVGAWVHASYFAFLLPPGINRRLLKAAIWLSLAALICFYSVLLHRLRQRPYGRRSWLLFAGMALASIYVVVERREAFQLQPQPPPRSTTFEGSIRPQVCVVGIEAATLDAILPLAEQGQLPFFGKILREGCHARLSTLTPSRSTPLWATLASGKYPYRHGIVGDRFLRAGFLAEGARLKLLPLGLELERWLDRGAGQVFDGRDLRVRPLWGILSRLGVAAGLVGWPLTSPIPEGVETSVSDRFFDGLTEGDSLAEHVFPEELAERARLFQIPTDELDPSVRSRFGGDPPAAVLEALARDLWIRDLGIFLLEQNPRIDVFFLRLPGLGEISRSYFGGYHAVQFKGELDAGSARAAAQLVSAYYRHLDELLAELWDVQRKPRWLVVASTHGAEGFRGWRELRRRILLRPAVRGFTDLGSDGVLLLLGEGFRPNTMLRRAQIVDLVPTLLYGLGFPIARDLDGAVLTDAFDASFLARQPLTFVPSYETFTRPH